MNKYLLSLFAIVFSVMLLSSCNKIKENQLEGTWSRVLIVDLSSENMYREYWTFSGDGIINIDGVTQNGEKYNFVGKYQMKSAGKYFIIHELNSKYHDYNYKWEILKLNSKRTILVNDRNGAGGLMYLEFEKK